MTRNRIFITVGILLLALCWTAFFWTKLAWPLLHHGLRKSPAGPPVAGMRADDPVRGRDIPPVAEIVGIGAMLRHDDDAGLPLVMNTVPGSPAERAGLKTGMLIQRVDATPLAGVPLVECINLIRGPVGSKLRLEVRDPEQNTVIPLELTRERLQLGGR